MTQKGKFAPPSGWKSMAMKVEPDKWIDTMVAVCESTKKEKNIHKNATPSSISLENIDDALPGELINTPRSLQACLELGVDPNDIQKRERDYFNERGLSKKLQEIKFQHHKKQRQVLIQRLLDERDRIVSNTASIFPPHGDHKSTPAEYRKIIAEKVTAREAILRGKEQRTLEQTAQYQAFREKMQEEAYAQVAKERAQRLAMLDIQLEEASIKSLKEGQNKAELRRLQNERAHLAHERDVALLLESIEQEKQRRRDGLAWYESEMEAQAKLLKEMENERKLEMEAELRRNEIQEQFRVVLKKMQEEGVKAAVKKEKEFKAKELEKMRFIEAQRSEKLVQLEKSLKEIEKREDAAADIWLAQPQQRRDDYDAKCEVDAIKQKRKKKAWLQKQVERRALNELKQAHLLATYKSAISQREERYKRLVAKLGEDEEMLRAYHEQKELMAAQINLEKKLFDSEKQDRVAMMERANALYRARLLNNINLETMKAKILLEARDELQATFQKNEAKRNMKTFDIK